MNLDAALQLWRGSGYRAINGILLREKAGEAAAQKYLRTTKVTSDANDAIAVIRTNMVKLTELGPYYRGASGRFKKNCHLETFVSVSKNSDDAAAFVDEGGMMYTITLAKGVRGISTGVEGEILLEDGCFWEVKGQTVTIHPPGSNKGFPGCSVSPAACPVVKSEPCAKEFELTPEEEAELAALGVAGGKRWKMPRKMSRKYCRKTPCRKMGFTQRSSCRPYKNCFTRRRK